MDRLEHGIFITDIGRRSSSQTALMLCCNICYNIAVQVWKYYYFNTLVKLRIQHFSAHSIY